MQREMEDLRGQCSRQLAQASQSTADKDLTIARLQEAEGKLQEELDRRRHDDERYTSWLLSFRRGAVFKNVEHQAVRSTQGLCFDQNTAVSRMSTLFD